MKASEIKRNNDVRHLEALVEELRLRNDSDEEIMRCIFNIARRYIRVDNG